MVFPMESEQLTSKLMTCLLYNSLKSEHVEGLVAHIEIIIIMCKQELSQKLSIGPIRCLRWVTGKPQTSNEYAVMIRIIKNLNNSAIKSLWSFYYGNSGFVTHSGFFSKITFK